ncbi:hypothetical protein [Asticcacaulis endophyticus]|uniref:Uncharacterized protein n=1 Tax=Asticcacaulis endophyticus TaxID=1395890 RepID=A0A918UUH9_9CAUL|nr:hypothetical protein [Asticcacaulis endophyticus]GGZ33714.1 hypothetical protein GCM10011273_20100 [Asticcacaulis endophyticus]
MGYLSSKIIKSLFAATLIFLPLQGCSEGIEDPSITTHLCAQNKEGIYQLKEELKLIASDENMKFQDYSEDVRRDLKIIDSKYAKRADGSPPVHFEVHGKNELGLTASNISLPGYQIAIGFAGGKNHTETEQFADKMITRLEKQWPVERLPDGTGATPKPGCR